MDYSLSNNSATEFFSAAQTFNDGTQKNSQGFGEQGFGTTVPGNGATIVLAIREPATQAVVTANLALLQSNAGACFIEGTRLRLAAH